MSDRRGRSPRIGIAAIWMSVALMALGLVSLAPQTLPAQERDFLVQPSPLLWGAKLQLGLQNYLQVDEQLNTTVWLHAGGWWGSDSYYRTPEWEIYTGDFGDPDDITSFNEWGVLWGLGFSQGLVPSAHAGRDLLRVETWYRAVYESHLLGDETDDLIARSGLPDAQGLLLNQLFLGLIYDSSATSATTKQSDGVEAELSAEVAPTFLANNLVGDSNFGRVNLTARYYRSLLDRGEQARAVPTLGVAAFASADQLFSLGGDHTQIPADARQSIGGVSPRSGVGGAVRALDSGRYDGNTKIVGNMELRAFFPYLIPVDVTPGLVVFLDAGYYSNPAGAPATSANYAGFLAGTGLGMSINVYDVASLVGYTGYNLTGTNVDGSSWMPFFLGFGLHY
jgi:hypothetical protein